MIQKICSLIVSAGAIILGIYLSMNSRRLFYGLILAGILYSIYYIYSIATHKQQTQKQQETQRKLAEQKTFADTPPSEITGETVPEDANPTGYATINVNFYKEKMGLGAVAVTVNGVYAGTVKKGNERVTYRTNVSFNLIYIGPFTAEVDLSEGDTVDYFFAGNGIRHERTVITRKCD